jgi:hypothetical protein
LFIRVAPSVAPIASTAVVPRWAINRRLVGLVGAGDSTKTTLLDAVGLVLSPNYNLEQL